MTTEPTAAERNAAFIDLMLQRWEVLFEHHIRLRLGQLGDDPAGVAAAAEQTRQVTAALERQTAALRREAAARGAELPLDQVVATYGLSPVEAQILELALAPQLDVSFRQRVARFHNNILLDAVDVDLALALLFPTRRERLAARGLFAADAPLFRQKLLVLRLPKEPKGSGLLALELKPPDRLADFVLGRRCLDASLRPYAALEEPETPLATVHLPAADLDPVVALVERFDGAHGGEGSGAARRGRPWPFGRDRGLAISITGPSGTGKTLTARALAHHLGRPLVCVDSGSLAGAGKDLGELAERLFDEARVQGAVLLFDRCEPLFSKGQGRLPALLDGLERFGGLAVLTASRPDELDAGVERYVAWQLYTEMPEVAERHKLWLQHLRGVATLADDVDIDDLATRYELTGGQIRSAARVAGRRAQATGDRPGPVDKALLRSSAQAQIRANMDDYSVRSRMALTLDDLVLPSREMVLIREVLEACRNRVFVMSKWGFGRRLVTGKGICILFKGEAGTGKTLCAEILAAELQMKLYQVSIPKIVSKYIGDTEKNIARIFSSARANHSMLLFDEADALFTKRVAVENAIDRFSNMEVNLLLQEIERFEGVTILTTNLDKNIDDAFARRIQFKIDFPFPEAQSRAKIWQVLFPPECPVADEIDFGELGEAFEISGGHIKNAVVRSAYRAAARGDSIRFEDIEFAAEQECKSAGKLFRSAPSRKDW